MTTPDPIAALRSILDDCDGTRGAANKGCWPISLDNYRLAQEALRAHPDQYPQSLIVAAAATIDALYGCQIEDDDLQAAMAALVDGLKEARAAGRRRAETRSISQAAAAALLECCRNAVGAYDELHRLKVAERLPGYETCVADLKAAIAMTETAT